MDQTAVSALLSATGGPAFALREGRLAFCTPEAQALGFREGALVEAALPAHAIPQGNDPAQELPLTLGGQVWLLRSAPVDEWRFCFLRRETPFIPAPNEHTLLHAASRIRLSLQDARTAVDRLEEQLPRTQEREASLALALRSIYRLTHTAENLELFSWLRSGSYRLRSQHVNLAARVEDFCREAAGLLQELGLCLRWELPTDYHTEVADWELISALLWELLANAAANSGDGQIQLEMKRLGEGRVLFTLLNLPKLPLEEARFHRHAEPQQQLTEGMGLGLSLAGIGAAVHGGSFLLSSRPDGRVEAALSVAVRKPQEDLVLSSLQTPASQLHPGLVRLSELLPRDSFHPDRVL